MKLFSIILPTLVASSSSAFACSGHSQLSERDSPQNNNSSTLFSVGTDPPQPPATLGYMLNHFALVISDVERTVHFYRDVLGLRTVLNYDMPEFTFIYLGYPDGGKNGTGYQTGQEMQNEQKNREGLIEFLHYNGTTSGTLKASSPIGFSHIGLVVPNITETTLRLEAAGTKFLKKAGGPIDPALAPYFGLPEGFEFPEAFTNGLLYPMAFFMDPDGYVFELQDPSLAEAIQQ